MNDTSPGQIKMRFALVNGQRHEAQPNLVGKCPICDRPTVARCGEVRIWHWAHQGINGSCDPWWENKTEWHRKWQAEFPDAWQEIVHQVEQGMTASEARKRCPVPMHRTTVYRLLKRVQCEGEQACIERRHGHPAKLRGEVLTFVLDYCQNHASAVSHEVQRLVAERFGLSVSVSQLNRVRAAHGLSRQSVPREKKTEN